MIFDRRYFVYAGQNTNVISGNFHQAEWIHSSFPISSGNLGIGFYQEDEMTALGETQRVPKSGNSPSLNLNVLKSLKVHV